MQTAEMDMALSLCEFVPKWSDERSLDAHVRQLITLHSGFAGKRPARIYIGSSFCPQLLCVFSTAHASILAAWCEAHGAKATLVLPIATECSLETSTDHAMQLVSVAGGVIDEVTVNDYGAFARWGQAASEGLPVTLNLGRLLNKDTRDPRDPEYFAAPYTPRLLEHGWQGWANLERLTQTYPVAGIEFDPTHAELDLSGLPEGIVPALHGPLCYMSTGQICEFASVGLEAQDVFRPNAACALQCQRTAIRYSGASGVEFSKIGRSVFFDPGECRIAGVHRCRYVFSPLKEVLG